MSKVSELIAELCPDGVEYKPLSEIATISRGGSLQKKDFTESGFPCIHYGQIYTKYGLFTDKTYTFVSEATALRQKKAAPGDIVMAVTSENIEDVCKCVVWLGNRDVAVSGHTAIIHHNQDPKYLAYYFHSSIFFAQKQKLAHGTKVIEVTPDKLNGVRVPVPPLEVQREIVRILNNFTELTAELTARKKQFEYYRDWLLENPQGEIEEVSMGEVLTFLNGRAYKQEELLGKSLHLLHLLLSCHLLLYKVLVCAHNMLFLNYPFQHKTRTDCWQNNDALNLQTNTFSRKMYLLSHSKPCKRRLGPLSLLFFLPSQRMLDPIDTGFLHCLLAYEILKSNQVFQHILDKMDEERHNPRIIRVGLDWIIPEEVVVFMLAGSGAMGDPGAVEFYSLHRGGVLYFYGNFYFDDLELDEVRKHLPNGLCFDKHNWFHYDDSKWELFGGGMGNQFLIRSEFFDEYQRRAQNYEFERRYYRNCVIPLEDYLLELASERV